MEPEITIYAIGSKMVEKDVHKALEQVPDFTKVVSEGPDRSIVSGAIKALSFVAKFVNPSPKMADGLIDLANTMIKSRAEKNKGATMKVKVGGTVLEVTNANRDQLIDLLDKAKEISQAANKL